MLSEQSTNKSKNIIVVILFFLLVISSILSLSISVLIMQLFLMSITIPYILKRDDSAAKLYVCIFAYSLMFVFLVHSGNYFSYDSPYYIGGSDDLNFENEGQLLVDSEIYSINEILDTEILGPWHNAPFFSLYIAWLINFSNVFDGYTTLLPKIMNAYYLLWICMLFEYLLKKYVSLNNKVVYITIMIFALTPNIQYINSHVFRDTLNLLQILLIVFLFERLIFSKKYHMKILELLLLTVVIYICFYTRTNSLAFAGILSLLIITSKMRIKKTVLLILLFVAAFVFKVLDLVNFDYFVQNYSNYLQSLSGDGLSSIIFNQPLLPFGIILRAFYAFITPFPNFFGLFKDTSMFTLDLIMLFVYLGVVLQILGIVFVLKRILKFDWLALAFLSMFLPVIATTFTFRHVIFYYPFLVAMGIDAYFSENKVTRKIIMFFTLVTACLFALIYLILKNF